MTLPDWLLALPACTVNGRPARYSQSNRERQRGVYAVWMETDHPYADPAKGRVGSALMVPVRDVQITR